MAETSERSIDKLVVMLDLDRTLYCTDDFMDDVGATLAAGFGVTKTSFDKQIPDFYVQDEASPRYYDFFAHLNAIGLDADEVETHLGSVLAGRNYLYSDVVQFLDFLADTVQPHTEVILTHGEQRYQRLKYNFAPELGRLTFIDTLDPKEDYIHQHFAGMRGVIIDDKEIEGMPDGFRHIWLVRDEKSPSVDAYESLIDVQKDWEAIIDSLT